MVSSVHNPEAIKTRPLNRDSVSSWCEGDFATVIAGPFSGANFRVADHPPRTQNFPRKVGIAAPWDCPPASGTIYPSAGHIFAGAPCPLGGGSGIRSITEAFQIRGVTAPQTSSTNRKISWPNWPPLVPAPRDRLTRFPWIL